MMLGKGQSVEVQESSSMVPPLEHTRKSYHQLRACQAERKGSCWLANSFSRDRLQSVCPDHVSIHQHQLEYCHTIRMDATKNDLTTI